MKKIFLIFALTTLMSTGLYATVKMNVDNKSGDDKIEIPQTIPEASGNNNLGKTFLAAIGMTKPTAGSDTAVPSIGGNSSSTLGVTNNVGSIIVEQSTTIGTIYPNK